MSHRFAIAGAGFSGAVLARQLAEGLGARCVVWEGRDHIAGNCHTARDAATGVMEHIYGPHIFHTSRQDVWDYVRRFGDFVPFVNRVKSSSARGVFSLPINLHTINQFFDKRFLPAQAREFVAGLGDRSIVEPRNFEEQALSLIGRELYEAFFYGYTKKQWGREPSALPASILKRLPVRFNYDDNYYADLFQAIPREGYTKVIQQILDHPLIEVRLSSPVQRGIEEEFDHLFFTGPLDAFYDWRFGRLSYRTVSFTRHEEEGDHQGVACMNYPDIDVPWTRIHEHKHFTPWETLPRTIWFEEFSRETQPEDTPYYPVRLAPDKERLALYTQLARTETKVSFLGRLATYRYLDMHLVIAEALDFAKEICQSSASHSPLPTFSADPLASA